MTHQDTMFGHFRTSEAPKAPDFGSIQKPPGYVGFVPFHLQQSQQQQRHPLASPVRSGEPALSLSLDRSAADEHGNVNNTPLHLKYQHQVTPFRPSAHRPSDVRVPVDETPVFGIKAEAFGPFDLKQQPLQKSEEQNEKSSSAGDGGNDVKLVSLSNVLPQSVSGTGSNVFQATKNGDCFKPLLSPTADDGNPGASNNTEPVKQDGESVSANEASNEGKAAIDAVSTLNSSSVVEVTQDRHDATKGNYSFTHVGGNNCNEGYIINENGFCDAKEDSTIPAKTYSDNMQDSTQDAVYNTQCNENQHPGNVAQHTEVAEGNMTDIDIVCSINEQNEVTERNMTGIDTVSGTNEQTEAAERNMMGIDTVCGMNEQTEAAEGNMTATDTMYGIKKQTEAAEGKMKGIDTLCGIKEQTEIAEGNMACIDKECFVNEHTEVAGLDSTAHDVNGGEFNDGALHESHKTCNEAGDGSYATNTKSLDESIVATNHITLDQGADGNLSHNGTFDVECQERDVAFQTPRDSNTVNQPSYHANTSNTEYQPSNVMKPGGDVTMKPGHEDSALEHPKVSATFIVQHAAEEQHMHNQDNTVEAFNPDFQSPDPQQSAVNQMELPQTVNNQIVETRVYGSNNVEMQQNGYGDLGNSTHKTDYESQASVICESDYDAPQAMDTDHSNIEEAHQSQNNSNMLDSQPMDHVVESEIPTRSDHDVVATYELGVIDNGALNHKTDATHNDVGTDQSLYSHALTNNYPGADQRLYTPALATYNGQDTSQRLYPPALATHNEVIENVELFMATLENFHASIRTRLTGLKFGDKEISLHKFYREVTSRGGLEQVLRSGLWKDVSQALGISSTPFTLRKHYMNQLFHYEQVYFFRAEGRLRVPPTPVPAPSLMEPMPEPGSMYEVAPEIASTLKKKKRKLDPMQIFGADPASSIGSIATGAITGKFNEGYLITIVLGTEKLYGVLYHTPEEKCTQQYASVPSLLQCVGVDGTASGLEVQLYGKKRKEYVRKKDPNAPKRTRTGYNIFFKEQRARLKQLYPDSKGHGKKVIEMWNKLPEHEKAHYISRGNEEREKYLKEYHEKMRLQNQASDTINTGNMSQNEHVHEHVSYDVSHDYHVSLDMENDVQSGQMDAPEMEQMYNGYSEPQSQFMDSGMPDSHMISEDAYEGQEEEEGDFTQEPVSEEDEEADMDEETYEEDVAMYSESQKAFDQQAAGKYQEQEYNTSKVENVHLQGQEYAISKGIEYQVQGQEYAISKVGSGYSTQGQDYSVISNVQNEYQAQGQDYNAIPNAGDEYQAQGQDYNVISNAGSEYQVQGQVYNGISKVAKEYPTQTHDYNGTKIGNEYPQQQDYNSNITNEYQAQEHDYSKGSKLGNEYQAQGHEYKVQEQDFGISKVGNEYQAQGQEYGISDVGNEYQVQEQEFGISKVGNEYQPQEEDYSNISKVGNDYQGQQQEYSISNVGNEYQSQEQEYNVPKVVYESEVLHGSVASKQSSYDQENTYSHTSAQSQEYVQFKPVEAASHVQTSYPMQGNGQINYLQQSQGDGIMPSHNFMGSDGYAYSSGMQLQAHDHLKAPEQAVLQMQDGTTDYTSAFHQTTQPVGSNIPARQVQSDQVYQERYPYNVHMPYGQMYAHPSQAFAARFAHPLYSLQLGDPQTHHYGNPFPPQLHQPQATNSDGHVYHGQDVFKQNLHK